jgi:hypothetical protein
VRAKSSNFYIAPGNIDIKVDAYASNSGIATLELFQLTIQGRTKL